MIQLRPYRPPDLLALYDVCLKTGASGADASAVYRDPMLLGHVYAAPYAVFCPETTFVLSGDHRVLGYVLGVPDSRRFERETEAHWFPLLRGLYPLPGLQDRSPDARMIRAVHRGYRAPDGSWAAAHPAHLHIDLLPEVQGGGWGRRLMETLLAALQAQGIPGVHLGVGVSNVSAQGFYERLGFVPLERSASSVIYGVTFPG
ncbi:GNAT family N-acetyltransferase [Deinococcus sp.]|uniref:GNAT family N-acetyltransferase n=1 Tax=Deinococcus sp. TaxID=47478 RepID=UPI003C7A6511